MPGKWDWAPEACRSGTLAGESGMDKNGKSHDGDNPLWAVAVHEAGHAAAAHLLGRAVVRVSVLPEGTSLGSTRHRARKDWGDRLEDASYECSYGQFVNGRIRRAVEVEILILLAGGLATTRATGRQEDEAGTGVTKFTSEEASRSSETPRWRAVGL